MNERIAKLYDQAIAIEDGGDYVCGELDPVKFAELIVKECADLCDRYQEIPATEPRHCANDIRSMFGVEEK